MLSGWVRIDFRVIGIKRRAYSGDKQYRRYSYGGLESGDRVSAVFQELSQVLVFGLDYSLIAAGGDIPAEYGSVFGRLMQICPQ